MVRLKYGSYTADYIPHTSTKITTRSVARAQARLKTTTTRSSPFDSSWVVESRGKIRRNKKRKLEGGSMESHGDEPAPAPSTSNSDSNSCKSSIGELDDPHAMEGVEDAIDMIRVED